MGIKTIGLLGKDGGEIALIVDIAITIPSHDTPRIQECHMLVYHAICEIVDEAF
jgi:D-sedoheptulose 7-phosphate isomerase